MNIVGRRQEHLGILDHGEVLDDRISQALLHTMMVRYSFHICQRHWRPLLQSLAVCVDASIISRGNTKGQKLFYNLCNAGKAEPFFFFWSHSWRPLHTHLSWAFYSSRQDPSMFNSKGLFFPLYFSVPMKVPCVWEKFNQNLGFKKYKVNAYIYAPTLIMVHNPQLIFCNLAGYSWVGGGYVCMWLSMMCTPWGRTPQLEFIWEVLPAIV